MICLSINRLTFEDKFDGRKIKRNLTVNESFYGCFEVIMKHALSVFFVKSTALWYSLLFCKWLELTFAKPAIQKHKNHSMKSKSGSWNGSFCMPFPHRSRNHFVKPFTALYFHIFSKHLFGICQNSDSMWSSKRPLNAMKRLRWTWAFLSALTITCFI